MNVAVLYNHFATFLTENAFFFVNVAFFLFNRLTTYDILHQPLFKFMTEHLLHRKTYEHPSFHAIKVDWEEVLEPIF